MRLTVASASFSSARRTARSAWAFCSLTTNGLGSMVNSSWPFLTLLSG
jgi:hypothetical protein